MVLRTIIYSPFLWPCCQWEGGRLFLLPAELGADADRHWGLQREVLTARSRLTGRPAQDELGPKDVLALRLYYDSLAAGHHLKHGFEPLPDYEQTMELIRDVGPRVRGILIGNQGLCELSYRNMHGSWHAPNKHARANIAACADFVRRVGTLVREAGATPFFAAMDWDILQDCYIAGGELREALNDVDAINFVACGYAMIPGAFIKSDLPEREEHLNAQRILARGTEEEAPGGDDFPVLRDYLRGGNFWSGLCRAKGIRAGNIEKLSAYGFKGFATKLAEHELWRLAKEFGENWWK